MVITARMPLYGADAQQSAQADQSSSYEWKFRDVDVSALTQRLSSIGISIPVELKGTISSKLRVDVPWTDLRNARAWRMGGTLTSDELTIDGVTITNLDVVIEYSDGDLSLEQLTIRVPDKSTEDPAIVGLVTGHAVMELVPRGKFTATLDAEGVPLAVFSSVFEELLPVAGVLSGSLTAEADVNRLRDPTAWNVEGPVKVQQFTLNHSSPMEAGTQLELSEGVVTARGFNVQMQESQITGDATLSLLGRRNWSAEATVDFRDLGSVLRMVSRSLEIAGLQGISDALSGALRGTAKLSGTLLPFSRTGSGRVVMTDLRLEPPTSLAKWLPLGPVPIERLDLDYDLQPDLLKLANISATVAGGKLKGAASVSLEKPKFHATLVLSEVRPNRILAEPFASDGTLQANVEVTIPIDKAKDLSLWNLTSNLAVSELSYSEWKLTKFRTGDMRLQEGKLTMPRLTADLDGKPVRLSLTLGVEPPYQIDAEYDLTELRLKNLDSLAQLSGWPDSLGGELSVNGEISGTLQPMALTSTGRAVGAALRVNRHQIDKLQTTYALSPDSFALAELVASLYGGSATGEATVSLGDELGARARLEWSDVDAGAVITRSLEPPIAATGRSDGMLSLSVPDGCLGRRDAWHGVANVALGEFQFCDFELRDIDPIALVLQDGELSIRNFDAVLDGEPVHAELALGIQPPWELDARFDLPKLRLDRLGSFPQLSMLKDRLSGRITLTGEAHGQLDPLALTGEGSAAIEPFTYAGYTVDRIGLDYELSDQSLRISGIDSEAWNGDVVGAAEIPLTLQTSGAADLQFQRIDIGRLLDQAVEESYEVQGAANGRLQIAVSAGQLYRPEAWDVVADVQIPEVRLQNLAVASMEAEARQQHGRLEFEAAGRALDGSWQLAGDREGPWLTSDGLIDPGKGSLTLQGANVGRLARVWVPALSDQLQALLDLTGAWEVTSEGLAWNADAGMAELSFAGRVIGQGLSLRLVGLNQGFRLEELSGSLAGGRLDASADADLSKPQPIDFRLNLRRADLEQLKLVDPQLSDVPLQGLVDLNLSGEAGRTWRMRGAAAGRNGRVAAFPFRTARFPVTFDWQPESGQLRLQSASGHVSLPSGRMTGGVKLRRTAGTMIDGDYRFYDVRLQSLLRELGVTTRIARGRASGTLTISGRNVRSIDDLEVRLFADLRDAQPMNMPVLSQIRSFVPGAAASGATRFQDGRLEALLRGDVIEISRLSLASSQLQVYVNGRVNRNGRLNLDAVVSSGQGENPVLAQLLLKRLVATSAPPVGALLLANDYLANRVVHLTIRGTIRQPVIQVKPFESLGEEAVRFFLRESIGVSG